MGDKLVLRVRGKSPPPPATFLGEATAHHFPT